MSNPCYKHYATLYWGGTSFPYSTLMGIPYNSAFDGYSLQFYIMMGIHFTILYFGEYSL